MVCYFSMLDGMKESLLDAFEKLPILILLSCVLFTSGFFPVAAQTAAKDIYIEGKPVDIRQEAIARQNTPLRRLMLSHRQEFDPDLVYRLQRLRDDHLIPTFQPN